MKVVEYETRKGKPYMKVFYRYKDDHRGCKTIEGFEPYFYVDANAEIPEHELIKRVEETDFTTLFGEPLKKVFTYMPGDVAQARKNFKRTFEADIPFTDRYKIDEHPFDDKPPRVFFFDIETTSLDTSGASPIISIACYDSLYKKYVIFIWIPDKEGGDPEDWWQSYGFYHKVKWDEDHIIHYSHSEQEMLEKFCDFFEFCDPDIVTGWNSERFDLPYLINRLNEKNIGAFRLSPLNKTKVTKDRGDIIGRVCFDLYPAYKKIHENNLDSFKLEEVAQAELGHGKEEGVTGDKVIETWVQNPDLLIKYNFKDVQLLVELDEKIGIIDFYRLFADKINMSLDMTLHNSKAVDMYLLNYCHERKIALPTNTNRARKKIKGAKVLEPKRGLLKDLAVFDLKSLYPSIMDTFNMSPETVNGFMDFKQEPRGLIPQVLEELMEERAKLKAAGENDKQRVVKELMNSFYGIMMFPNFRLMVPEIGESITNVGREIIMWTKGIVEKAGYEVIFGDTDSVGVKGIKTDEEAIKLQKTINSSYDEFIKQFGITKHKFIIEYETKVDIGLFTGKKKRYALKTGDEYKIRGFEYRRSNVSRLGRELQYKVLTSILEGVEREEITGMVEEVEKIVKAGEDLDNIGIPQSITMPLNLYKAVQPHVRAAKYTNENLNPPKQIGALDKILLFYVKACPSDKPKTDVIALDFGAQLPSGYILDDKMHIEKIHKLIEPIYEAVGWKMVSSAQQTLSTF